MSSGLENECKYGAAAHIPVLCLLPANTPYLHMEPKTPPAIAALKGGIYGQ